MNVIRGRRASRTVSLAVVCVSSSWFAEPATASPGASSGTGRNLVAGVTIHAPDAFYNPPAHASRQRGALLRSEPLKGVSLPDGLRGWRILYATSVDDKTPATAVATVFAPIHPPPGPRPVLAWEHGTTGLLQKCMPSLASIPTAGVPALGQIAKAGWVIVAADYSFAEKGGPHPYIIGEGEARAALDSVRAARRLPGLALDARTMVWGHSQGGHSALWTGIVAPGYAPDVDIVGIAAIAPAANMANVLTLNPGVDKRLGPYVAGAYSRFYPDVTFETAVRPEALAAARQIASLCGALPPEDEKRIEDLVATFEAPALALGGKALAARLAENTPDHPIAAPVLIAQGLLDVAVPPAATDAFVAQRCAAGQRLDYWTFAGLDHGAIVQPGSPLGDPLIVWMAARFANEPQKPGCARKSF